MHSSDNVYAERGLGQRQGAGVAPALVVVDLNYAFTAPQSPLHCSADEAVSALDVSVQAQVLTLLDEIRQRLNLAMLFITHDLRVAAQVCDRVAVMSHGRVVEYGTVSEVFANPQNDYTKSLLAAAPGRAWEFSGGVARPLSN